MRQRIGTGGVAIIHEIREFRQRVTIPSGQPVRLWTRDDSLERAYAAWNS